jgi:hypothetical protein
MKHVNLNTLEATHFAKLKIGERMVVVRAVKPQPPEGFKLSAILHYDGYPRARFWRPGSALQLGDGIVDIKCPLPPGSLVACKETWKPTRSWIKSNTSYVRYEADGARLEIEHNKEGVMTDPWRSAAQMPLWACRHFGAVVSAECRRFSMVDCCALGIDAERAKDYLRRYGFDTWCWITQLERSVRPNA